MEQQSMSFTAPLQRAWSRAQQMLFKPFDIGRWLVIGFAAWLAALGGGGGGGTNFGMNGSGGGDAVDAGEQVAQGVHQGWEWLLSHGVAAGLILVGVLVLVAIIVAVLWVGSRGKFIFLDNVLRNQAAIVEPWKRFRRLGNSLFAFRLLVMMVCLPLAVGLIGLCIWLIIAAGGWPQLNGVAMVVGVVAAAFIGGLLLIATLYAAFFLDAFVVPLMYRFDLGVLAAWRRFLGHLRTRAGGFLLCGLFVFGLYLLVFSAIMVTGVMTCCLGFILVALPYVGTVVLLPIHITYRAFTVAFLAQIEPEIQFTN
ncbi:MAG: hypothetical protein K8J08_05465 [Thermoanaerobaculia bacterium]|nr:hypothetical protein [Thermoanaerobaculia bacterium]